MGRAGRFVLLAALTGSSYVHALDGFVSCQGERLQADQARVLPCTGKPNCVASAGVGGEHPSWSFSRAGASLQASLRQAIEAEPGARIEIEAAGFVVASFRSRIFGFVDEAQFLIADDGRIDYRSGACSGYHDFGVNRRRLERIRARLGG